jgi:riboflavin biosynthesis pyrimidine reductase
MNTEGDPPKPLPPVSEPSLALLYEADHLPAFDLPAELARLYAGTLGFEEPRLFANFVATLDGVVAIPTLPGSNRLIAASSSADRFVMGLLRACSDAVMIGSGTLSASPGSTWTPARAFPAAADSFAELRRRLGREGDPELVVLSASGQIDPAHPALAAGALVLSSDHGTERLRPLLPASAQVVSLGPEPMLGARAIVAALTERGHRLVLSEGGPRAIGPLLAAGLVDELFLTLSPLLLGRPDGGERPGLVEGVDLLPGAAARLLGARRAGEHLFLRYAIGGG